MEHGSADLLGLIGALAQPEARPRAAAALARRLGGEGLMLFARDPELGVLLPAPGFPQVLHGAKEWQRFVEACAREGVHSGRVPGPGGQTVPARGCALPDGTTVVLLGRADPNEGLEALRPLLPLLSSLFRNERRLASDEARVRSASEALQRSQVLTRALQQMRERLADALVEADAARHTARERAEFAEALAAELRAKAEQLQEQALELELLNRELAERTEQAELARAAADAANHAKSEFLAIMSHELRTPLNAVIGYTDLLLAGVPERIPEVAQQQVRRIGLSSRHLLALIEEILTFSRLEAGEERIDVEEVQLDELLAEVEALTAPLAVAKGIDVEIHLPDLPPQIRSDSHKIRQILVNLLGNAIKFTQHGRVSVTLERDEGAAVIRVKDTGPGIAPDHLERIFEPFWQVEGGHTRTVGGTGLGLSVTRRLARLLGGDVAASSQLGCGSTFTVTLPAEPPTATSAA